MRVVDERCRVRSSLAVVLAAACPVVHSGSVLSSLGNGRRTQQRPPHSVAGHTESDRGDETPVVLSTHVPRTEATLNTTFTQERLQPECTKGKGQQDTPTSPRRPTIIL